MDNTIGDRLFTSLFIDNNQDGSESGKGSEQPQSSQQGQPTEDKENIPKTTQDPPERTQIKPGTSSTRQSSGDHIYGQELPNLNPTKQELADFEHSKKIFDRKTSRGDLEKIFLNYKNWEDYNKRIKQVIDLGLYKKGELDDKTFWDAHEKAGNWFRVKDAINNGKAYRSIDGTTFYRFGDNAEGSEIDGAIKSFYGDDALRVFENKQDYDDAVAENYITGRALTNNGEITFSDPEIEYLRQNPEFAKNIARWTAQNYGYGINLYDFKDNPELQKFYSQQVLDRLKKDGRLSSAVRGIIVNGFDGREDMAEAVAYTGFQPSEIRAVDYAFQNRLIDRAGDFIDQRTGQPIESTPPNPPKYSDYTNGFDKVIKKEDIKNLPKNLQQISQRSPSTMIWRYHPSLKSGVYLVQDPRNPKLWLQYREDGSPIGNFRGKATSTPLKDGVRINPQEHQKEIEQIENWRNLSKFGNRVDLEEIQHKADSLDSPFFVDASGNVHTAYGTQSLSAWAAKHGFNPFDYSKTTDVIDKSGKLTPRAQRYIERYNAMSPEQKAEYDAKNPWFKQFLTGVNRSENSALNRTIAQPGLKWKDWSDTQKFGTMAGLGLGSLAFMSMLGKNKKDWFDYLMMLGVPIASIFGGSYLGNYLDPRTNPGTYNAKAYADYVKNAQKQAADAAKAANNAASGSK